VPGKDAEVRDTLAGVRRLRATPPARKTPLLLADLERIVHPRVHRRIERALAAIDAAAALDGPPRGEGEGDVADVEGEGGAPLQAQVPTAIALAMVDFAPFLFAQYGGGGGGGGSSAGAIAGGGGGGGSGGAPPPSLPYIVFPSFDALCDEYFSRSDVAKASTQSRAEPRRRARPRMRARANPQPSCPNARAHS